MLTEAAGRAGIEGVELLAEPVAAALMYAENHSILAPVAVYDLGAGTFDVAVLEATDQGIVVKGAPKGIDPIGGLSFDQKLFEVLDARFALERADEWEKLRPPANSVEFSARFNLDADIRAAKEALSETNCWEIPVLGTLMLITREEFEELIRPDVQRTVDLTLEVIASAGVKPADLSGLFMVGGASRVPLVKTMLYDSLGVQPRTEFDPKTVVALGGLRWGALQRAAGGDRASDNERRNETAAVVPLPILGDVGGAGPPESDGTTSSDADGNVGSEASPSPEGRRTKTLVGLVSLLALVAIVVVAAVLLSGGGSNGAKKIALISNQRTKTRVTSSPTSTTIASTTTTVTPSTTTSAPTNSAKSSGGSIPGSTPSAPVTHPATATPAPPATAAPQPVTTVTAAVLPPQMNPADQNKSVSITNPNLYLLAGSFSVPNNAAPWVLSNATLTQTGDGTQSLTWTTRTAQCATACLLYSPGDQHGELYPSSPGPPAILQDRARPCTHIFPTTPPSGPEG